MKKIFVQSKDIGISLLCENVEWSLNGLKLFIGKDLIGFFQTWDFWYEVKDE